MTAILKRLATDRIFLIGLVLFVIGSGPLLAVLLAATLGWTSDPSPNPLFFGMMAALTFWPALILMLVAVLRVVRSVRREAA